MLLRILGIFRPKGVRFPEIWPPYFKKDRYQVTDRYIRPGHILTGPLFNEPVRVETVMPNGPDSWVLGLVGTQSEKFRKVTLTAKDLQSLTIHDTTKSYDGDGQLLRLGLQAYALGIGY